MLAFVVSLALADAAPRRQLAAAQREQIAAEARAARFDRAAAAAESRGARLAAKDAALAGRVQAGEAMLAAAKARLALVTARHRGIELRIAGERAPLARLLAAQARIARRPPLAIVIGSHSIADAGRLHALLTAAQTEIDRRTATMRDDLSRSARLRTAEQAALRSVSAETAALAHRRQALALAGQRLLAERATDESEAEHARADALAAADRAATLDALADRLDREGLVSATLAELSSPLRRPPDPSGPIPVSPAPPPARDPAYRLPALGQVVAAGDGARGLTLATTPGAQTIAPANGRVAYAGPFRTYGGVVIIDHGGGWTSVIAGLAPAIVATGTVVIGGSPIGRASSRLTVELRHRGRLVDAARMAQMPG